MVLKYIESGNRNWFSEERSRWFAIKRHLHHICAWLWRSRRGSERLLLKRRRVCSKEQSATEWQKSARDEHKFIEIFVTGSQVPVVLQAKYCRAQKVSSVVSKPLVYCLLSAPLPLACPVNLHCVQLCYCIQSTYYRLMESVYNSTFCYRTNYSFQLTFLM